MKIGWFTLNKNPMNYFAEVEQAAFAPAHLVPGIEPSPDKMLQGRLFSYVDTHFHRIGPNPTQIPINCPMHILTPKGKMPRAKNYQRDGFGAVADDNQGEPS